MVADYDPKVMFSIGMRSSLVVWASDCQWRSSNSPGFNLSILRHSGIWGAAEEAVLNIVHRKKIQKDLVLDYKQKMASRPGEGQRMLLWVDRQGNRLHKIRLLQSRFASQFNWFFYTRAKWNHLKMNVKWSPFWMSPLLDNAPVIAPLARTACYLNSYLFSLCGR